MIKVKTNITNNAKLPLSIVKGNELQRKNLAQEYSDLFVKNINKESNSEYCSFTNIKHAIQKTIFPNKINLKLFNNQEKDFVASVGLNYSEKSDLDDIVLTATGYNFYYRNTTPKKKNIPKYVAVHEARHIFDYLVNPKTTSYRFSGVENDNICEVGNRLYSNFLENLDCSIKFSDFEKSIRDDLSKIPPETRIDLLQNIRFSLVTEINAYKDELKYLIKSPLKNFNKIIDIVVFMLHDAKFNSKLMLGTELLKEELSAHRKEIASFLQ